MRILHSISRVFGCKTEDDQEAERLIYPHPTLHRMRNRYYPTNGHSSQRLLPKRAIVDLLPKARFIFNLPKPSNTADPILPIQNPEPSISNNDPLLVQTLPVSSPISGDSSSEIASTTLDDVADFNIDDDQESQGDNVVAVVSSQQWPIESSANRNHTDDATIISIPDEMCLFANTCESDEEIMGSAHVYVEETFPENVHSLEEREEEEKMMIESGSVAVDEGRWIKHYSSRHGILLVGEGDFSFSASLAVAFGFASKMIATSLNTEDFLMNNYQNAPSNIANIRSRGCRVMHGIDATKMANHPFLGQFLFDRVIYNFPFAGFFKNLLRDSVLRRHRRLVSLFLMNAKEMIDENGEIHITHKTNGFHMEWKIESIASSHGLRLIEAVDFNHLDYPGYNTKRGFGGDENFYCYPSKTYKFGSKKIR